MLQSSFSRLQCLRFCSTSARATVRCASLVCLLLLPLCLYGQSTALLTGTVTDPSGAAVPQAEVNCRNTETGLNYRATTNIEGLFRFPDLPIGIYDLTVSRAGFAPLRNQGITLVTGHSVDLRLRLQV